MATSDTDRCYQFVRIPQTILSLVICWKDSQNLLQAVVYIKDAGENQPREPAHGQVQGVPRAEILLVPPKESHG